MRPLGCGAYTAPLTLKGGSAALSPAGSWDIVGSFASASAGAGTFEAGGGALGVFTAAATGVGFATGGATGAAAGMRAAAGG